ncbi:glycosyltransferase family 4 protein [Nocardioides pocheonensis]|uniref:Glycosyltransferase n=1 Tax=Nocardioides pocheonensis TaxID=661485 RepID=A0A3N0GQQ6_9ACTN|nr:glycosyltransferase family 4 protein [Nocardioides pocheonensis]RNM14775.1 glycosyltransferase [Nocardioides pocheonensis]
MPPEPLHVVAPEGIDDPARPSGGNHYDRRLVDELRGLDRQVHVHEAPGAWPDPSPPDVHGLGTLLDELPDQATLLVDGLVASAVPDLLARRATRLRLFVLVHLPLGVLSASRRPAEAALLARVAGVVATSGWTRAWLHEHYDLPEERVHVAVPGTDAAGLVAGSRDGGALLCVGAVTPTKGQDVLVEALTSLADLPWRCTLVGSLEVDPGFAERLCEQLAAAGLADRVTLAGVRTGPDLDATYAAADLLVLPSRAETYGMVLTEALARGLPAVAARTGGTPESLGRTADGRVPGLFVPPGDADALAAALRSWLTDSALRTCLRATARVRRGSLPAWSATARAVARALEAR